MSSCILYIHKYFNGHWAQESGSFHRMTVACLGFPLTFRSPCDDVTTRHSLPATWKLNRAKPFHASHNIVTVSDAISSLSFPFLASWCQARPRRVSLFSLYIAARRTGRFSKNLVNGVRSVCNSRLRSNIRHSRGEESVSRAGNALPPGKLLFSRTF